MSRSHWHRGPLSGAEIKAYRLTDLVNPVEGPITSNDSLTDMDSAGSFTLTLENIPDDEWIMVTATGGQDIDVDDDGTLDASPTYNVGTIHAMAKASDWRSGGKINVLTEICYQQLKDKINSGQTSSLDEDLSWVSNQLVQSDLNEDGAIDYRDLIEFNPKSAAHRKKLHFLYESLYSDSSSSLIGSLLKGDGGTVISSEISSLFGTDLKPLEAPKLREVTPEVAVPGNEAGITEADVVVSSMVSDKAEIFESEQPTLLIGENSEGKTLLLGYAKSSQDAGDEQKPELSIRSTTLALVMLRLSGLEDDERAEVETLAENHSDFDNLVANLSSAFTADPFFLDSLMANQALVDQIKEISQSVFDEYTATIQQRIQASLRQMRKKQTITAERERGILDAIKRFPGLSFFIRDAIAEGSLHENFGKSSPWLKDQPWNWYGEANKLNVGLPPFLAVSENNPSLMATANPTMLNYAVEFYDNRGNYLDWFLVYRNETYLNKKNNDGAAMRSLMIGRDIETKATYVEFHKYLFSGQSSSSGDSSYKARRYGVLAINMLHLASSTMNTFAGLGGPVQRFVKAIKTQHKTLFAASECLSSITGFYSSIQSLQSTLTDPDDIKGFLFEFAPVAFEGTNSLSEIASTCAKPLTGVSNSIKSEVAGAFATILKKIGLRTINPLSWLWIAKDTLNDLGPLGASLVLADTNACYDLSWSDNNQINDITVNAACVPPIAPNEPPEAAITAPQDGASVITGEEITFTGSGTDSEDGALTGASLVWSSDKDGQIGTGATLSTSDLSINSHTVTLTATDGDGDTGTATVSITVAALANVVPTASISAPEASGSFTEGDEITFTGSGADSEDGTLSGASLVWNSSLDGALGTGATLSKSDLSVGDHTITLTVTDSAGETGTATVSVSVSSPTNAAPTATISAPTSGSSFTSGNSVSFTGSGADSEDGTLSGASLVWSSDKDGQIGTGGSVSSSGLSVNSHTITLTATDSGGASDAATVSITIEAATTANVAPSVSITSPADGVSYTEGESISFTADVSDSDGSVSSTVWDFGDSSSSLVSSTSHSYDSAGTYTVTLTVTDDEGSSSQGSVSITINSAACDAFPATTLTAPTDGVTGQSTTPTFSWSAASCGDETATVYRLMLAANSADLTRDASTECTDCLYNSTTSSTSLTLDAGILQNAQTYYWQIRAGSDTKGGYWSDIRAFSTSIDTQTAPGTYPAPVPRSGQTTSYATGDDGDLQPGVAWPNPRFSDNGDGTVTDNLTGLIWLKNANCWGGVSTSSGGLDKVDDLNSGTTTCEGYTGRHTDWRLPNVKELESLVDIENTSPALPTGHPFFDVQSHSYMSGSSSAIYTDSAWNVNLYDGSVYVGYGAGGSQVWPVRGGQ